MTKVAILLLSSAAVLLAQAHSVSLSWSPSTSPNLAGYNVSRGTTSGGPYTKLNAVPVTATTYLDPTVSVGSTYYYVATAVAAATGLQSANSNQAVAPLLPPTILTFSATPGTITAGSSTSLSWTDSGNATARSILPTIGTVTTSPRTASPAATTTYTLTESNPFGTVVRATTVTVNPIAVFSPFFRRTGAAF